MSTKPQISIHNAKTDEIIIREMTDEEYEQHKIDVAQMQAESAKFDAYVSAKESAIAKLAALGLTEDEAKAILG